MFTVLFVCSGNTCRSPIAENLLRRKLAGRRTGINVSSAGIYANPGESISPGARRALQVRGIDAGGFLASALSEQLVGSADLILTMTRTHLTALNLSFPAANDKTYMLSEFCAQEGDLSDPFGGGAAEYENCCERIDKLLDIAVEKLVLIVGDRKS